MVYGPTDSWFCLWLPQLSSCLDVCQLLDSTNITTTWIWTPQSMVSGPSDVFRSLYFVVMCSGTTHFSYGRTDGLPVRWRVGNGCYHVFYQDVNLSDVFHWPMDCWTWCGQWVLLCILYLLPDVRGSEPLYLHLSEWSHSYIYCMLTCILQVNSDLCSVPA